MREKTALEAALEYAERGWSVIPIHPETKRPLIKWRQYQASHPDPEEIEGWFGAWPDAQLAVVTGELSGVVVVDTDNPEAEAYARKHGLARTPMTVRTKNGRHFYFAHPKDGVRRGPRAGVNVRRNAPDWPAIEGLDFRGDGSYALLPPSKNYSWEGEVDFEDLPVWSDWVPPASEPIDKEFSFADLDLSDVPAIDGRLSEWERTAQFVIEKFPSTKKIPSGLGNGRNERVMRYASECVLEGFWGQQLRLRVIAYMREFFVEPLPFAEFEATCGSVEEMERRNHPERFDEEGNYIHKPEEKIVEEMASHKRKLIYARDAEALIEEADARSYLIEPWLRKGTINQFYAYSGHGKSTLVANALYALACGCRNFGPWEMPTGAARVLYLDYENGPGTIGVRLGSYAEMYGDAEDRFAVWTPFLKDGEEMDLNTPKGMADLEGWVKWYRPDVVVIDTIRSAFPGMSENDASEWGRVNKLAIKLRNAGYAVILIHHSNKPGDDGFGREAGSTNQLTTLETQIRITQVFEDKETAHQNAGIYDDPDKAEAVPGEERKTIYNQLREKLPENCTINMVVEVRYGKVREWTDMHDRVQHVGWATHNETGKRMLVASYSSKQRAKVMATAGMAPIDIANALHKPARTIRKWLELPGV